MRVALARLLTAAAVVLTAHGAVSAQSRPGPGAQPACAPHPDVDRLPSIIAPMAGEYPVWLVTGSRWPGRDMFAKSVLVLSRGALAPLRVRGHLLDGQGVLMFRDGADSDPTEVFSIEDPRTRSVTPGGAAPEIMASYAFIMLGISYPDPGCWEFTIHLGERVTTIVRQLR